MQIPTWLKPALYGAAVGAIALTVVGFSWGGWITNASAQKLSDTASSTAVATAMTPYCVAQSKTDPNAAEVMTQLNAAQGYNRRGVIEKAGWATLIGTEKPNSELAKLCEAALAAT